MKRRKILIASVVRKVPQVVEAMCKTLQWQRLRDEADIDIVFVPNFADSDTFANNSIGILKQYGKVAENVANPGDDYGETPRTRHWKPTAWHRVGEMKDGLIREAIAGDYDYLWLNDADVLCDPYTLQSLIDCEAPIVSAVYWTFWSRHQEGDAQKQHCGPQVWLVHPYQLNGRGWTEAEFRNALITRQRTQVWGLGACTLINKSSLHKGVSFHKQMDLPPGPMADGEDRHFCWRASALHLDMYADPWSDVWHAYHPQEYGDIDRRMQLLAQEHPESPSLGDLVSLKISALEPTLTSRGWLMPPTQWVRGRLGLLNVMPEIEEAATALKRGGRELVHVHFPVHYEMSSLRGQRRIMQVDLLDCKPHRLPPTIEEELLEGTTGRLIDPTIHTEENVVSLVENANV